MNFPAQTLLGGAIIGLAVVLPAGRSKRNCNAGQSKFSEQIGEVTENSIRRDIDGQAF